ncbi:MAG TPA: hypothetical protein VF784_06655 [Anaerolineales bacterium]
MGATITLELAQSVLGTATSQTVLAVVSSIRRGDPAAGLDAIHRALDSGADPRTLARQIVDYLRDLMLIQMGNGDQVEATKELKSVMAEDARAFATADVLRMMKTFNEAAVDTRGGWQPSLSLELALAGAFESPAKTVEPGTAPSGGASGSSAPRPSSGAGWGTPSRQAKPEAKTAQQEAAPARPRTLYQSSQEETPQAAAAAPAPKGVISIEQVVRSWKDVRAAIKPAHPAVEALLNSCKPMDVRGDVLLLGFQSETVRGLMDKPENLEVTRRAIADVLGVALNVQLVVTNAQGKLPPNIAQDGMVAAAINHGGKIVNLDE